MTMTPRELHAFLFLAGKRRQRELREQLQLTALASRADEKAIRTQLKDWEN